MYWRGMEIPTPDPCLRFVYLGSSRAVIGHLVREVDLARLSPREPSPTGRRL
jgi:hypothetical protein